MTRFKPISRTHREMFLELCTGDQFVVSGRASFPVSGPNFSADTSHGVALWTVVLDIEKNVQPRLLFTSSCGRSIVTSGRPWESPSSEYSTTSAHQRPLWGTRSAACSVRKFLAFRPEKSLAKLPLLPGKGNGTQVGRRLRFACIIVFGAFSIIIQGCRARRLIKYFFILIQLLSTRWSHVSMYYIWSLVLYN